MRYLRLRWTGLARFIKPFSIRAVSFGVCIFGTGLNPGYAASTFSVGFHGGIDVSNYGRSNVDGGIGYTLGIRPEYFFSENVGLFAGLDYSSRPLELGSYSQDIGWVEFPIGIAFRYGSWGGAAQNSFGLGMFFAEPLDNFDLPSGTENLASGRGFVLLSSTNFPVTPNFSLGMSIDYKLGFDQVFESHANSKRSSLSIGLGGRLTF